ncbi:hypothetical protein MKW98_030441, partial [Papaver atlanticum]
EMDYYGKDNKFHIDKLYIQNLLDNNNIDSDIIDYYITILEDKMGKGPANGYGNHVILNTNTL